MFSCIKRFCRDESGAVTVDWVVLTAAITGLAASLMIAIQASTVTLGDRISVELDKSFNTP